MSEIRRATLDDIPQMVAVGKLMHEESRFREYDYDPKKVSELITILVNSTAVGIPLVAVHDGVIVGGFLGGLVQFYFGKNWVASDYALFLAPEFRQGTLGVRLMKQYISEAIRLGADEIQFANNTGYKMDQVKALAERCGFTHNGYCLSRKV